MNKAVMMITTSSKLVPNDFWADVQKLYAACGVALEWLNNNPCPVKDGAEFASENEAMSWFLNRLGEEFKASAVNDDIVYAYVQSAFPWTGLHHGRQFFYPPCREVYGRWLCRQ